MPSNAQNKPLGPKNQNKPITQRNASRPATTKDANPTTAQTHSVKSQEPINIHNRPGKAAPVAAAADMSGSGPSHDIADEFSSGVGVNKKKQKRRQKEAARKAAEQPSMTAPQIAQQFANVADSAYQNIVKEMAAAQAQGESNGYHYTGSDYNDPEQYEPEEEDVVYYRDEANRQYQHPYDPRTNGHTVHEYIAQDALGGKAKKKKKAKANSSLQDTYSMDNPSLSTQRPYHPSPPPPPPPLSQHVPSGGHQPTHNDSKDRIWNTSTAEERERIKEFWQSLHEEERRSLVKVEKEAVLKKMKEQQKHSCSCTVCGRKRTAIEEELEVLYDAYYEELEVYASPLHSSRANRKLSYLNTHLMARPPNPHAQMHSGQSSRGRIQELGDDDEAGDEEEYSDEEDEEDLSDDELEDQTMHPAPSGGSEFFNFEKSLTVQGPPSARINSHWTQCTDALIGGILTVADDLLKNDGKKFIEMMEQLAERRMQREEDQYARAGLGHPPIPGHNHDQPADEDTFDDEEDDEEYDEDDEEFDEEDEMVCTCPHFWSTSLI